MRLPVFRGSVRPEPRELDPRVERDPHHAPPFAQPVSGGVPARVDRLRAVRVRRTPDPQTRDNDDVLEVVSAVMKAMPDGDIDLYLRGILRIIDDLEALGEFTQLS